MRQCNQSSRGSEYSDGVCDDCNKLSCVCD